MWDLTRLRLLRELQLRGTVTAVARSLAYSPSTVSQQLAKLEREVGAPLLEPDGRRVRLTRQGEVVAAHAARVMDLEEQVRGELDAVRPGSEAVRISALETVAQRLLPDVLDDLTSSHPHLRVEIAVLPPEDGLFELEGRSVDVTIAEQYPGLTRPLRSGVHRESLGSDPVRLAVPAGSSVASLSDAAELGWVTEPRGTMVQQWIVQQCRAAGFEPDLRYESADLQVHVQLVASGHAVSAMPDLAWPQAPTGIRLVDLPGEPRRELFTSVREAARHRSAIEAVRRSLATALARHQAGRSGQGG